MELKLGPIPPNVRSVVSRLVIEAQLQPREVDDRPNGFLLTGGPSGCSYLDADGEIWNLCVWDYFITRVEDGPMKVALIALAAERVPELAEWLPHRPLTASDCHACNGAGWLQPPLPRIRCPECVGLGWRPA